MAALDSFLLTDKVTVITGGAGLLGEQHAHAVLEAGGIPVIVDINADRLSEISLIAPEINTYECDVTKPHELQEMRAWLDNKFGRIDCLVNNAAINPKVESHQGLEGSRFENYSVESYSHELNVGLTSAMLTSQIFGQWMAKKGAGVIVNIASDLGLVAPNQSLYKKSDVPEDEQPVKPVTYSIIKHGLIGLTRYTATYWADRGVRCNALAPGGVENGQNQTFLNRIQEQIPMGRMAKPNEYQAALIFLLSTASSYMNGSVLSIDGGRTCW